MDIGYLCRFCLSTSDNNMCKIQECDIFSKIRTFLTIDISIDESLPNKLCNECIKKISDMTKFCLTVQENENKLRKYLKDGTLHDYYLNFTNNVPIKAEEIEPIIFCDSQCIKNEGSNTELATEKCKIKSKRKLNKAQNKDNNLDYNNQKDEELADHFNSNHSSSDDDTTLSTIKIEKELHTAPTEIQNKKRHRKKRKANNSMLLNEPHHTIDTNKESVKQFTCLTCLKPCDSQTDLNKHYHKEHLNKNISTKYTEKDVDGNIMYGCDICEENFSTKKDILKHVDSHNDERPLICKLCGRTYKTVMEIIRHARVHSGVKLQCSYNCGYSTAYQGALKEHENRHQSVHKYTCEKCGKGFNVKTWYEQHQNIHTGLKPFVCSICGLAFHMARYLTAHRSSMHPQSSSVKRYICVHCGQKCDSANSLSLHLEEHGINKEKEFLCDFCGKILSSADQLKYHHRMHSGVKPYSCSICNKSFAKRYNVKVHMTSHSGEKIHSCPRCGKRYAQRSTLLQHLKRHHAGTSPERTA
ncbi:zinc finger protein OZF [Helicoverpa armigera]|uniref:zinc finger protein OZF n=1 Tax=Helicoverpa armigera TaxID=29058 RepID=UPI003082CEC9